jgi:S-DNA-T family DNA segregation ATPase FtsK/SpoIIIE
VTSTRRAPARKPSQRKRAPAKKKKPSLFTRIRTALATHLGRQADDIWGVVLVLAGVLSALAVYANVVGPAGEHLRDAAQDVLGWGRFMLPVALVGVGAALLQGRPRHEPARAAIGFGFLLVAVSGLAEVAKDSGGFLGSIVGDPLKSLLAAWGAAAVLLTVLFLAVLVLTRTPVRGVTAHVGAAVRAVGRLLARSARALVTLGHRGEMDHTQERHPSSREMPEPDMSGPDLEPEPEPLDEPEIMVHVDDLLDDASEEQLKIDLGPAVQATGPRGPWRLPPAALLKRAKAMEVDRRMLEAGGRTLEDALAAHGVETTVVGMTVGPTVTRYELELGAGVKVARVTSLNKDIAYAMASPDVRILAPIPGRSAIGVEVPNRQRQLVSLGDILSSADAKAAVHPLEVGLGQDIAGRACLMNLAEMPHLLVAGATGAGKSSCINAIVSSILMRSTPDQVRMILVDPKRVELGNYNNLPHLLTPVVVNPKRAANALSWAVKEMERRYDVLAEVGVRDITGYNAAFDRGELRAEPGHGDKEYLRLPFILIIVDELNDLMMVAARDVEESICRIAQMARAVGIHLVIATQRPSVDVITGVIKANVPSRLAFAVSSLADSRVILDQPGAERLIGKGDLLLLSAASNVARRVQGAWVSEDEVHKIVAHWRRQSGPQYLEGIEGDDTPNLAGTLGGDAGDDDDMLEVALDLIVRSQLGSTSMLQRKLKVGFARAGRLMDLLERRGVVGPSEGSKARAVLMTVEELENLRESAR